MFYVLVGTGAYSGNGGPNFLYEFLYKKVSHTLKVWRHAFAQTVVINDVFFFIKLLIYTKLFHLGIGGFRKNE